MPELVSYFIGGLGAIVILAVVVGMFFIDGDDFID